MKTPRLLLRPLDKRDAERISALAGVWEVASMTGRIPYPYSADAALHWVDGLADGEVVFGIERDGRLIGICGFTPDGTGAAEIGYWIGRDYWGQGYATEAAQALMRYGFTKLGIRRFTCCHFSGNAASQRVIEKLGFKSLGPCEGWCEAHQKNLPTVRYELRRPWRAAIRALAS